MNHKQRATKVLVIFGSPFLYGMERAVIELFDAMRPDVDPQFLVSQNAVDLQLPVIHELRRRSLRFTCYRDRRGYPRIQKTRSPFHLIRILRGLLGSNLDAVRASRGSDVIYIANGLALIGAAGACIWFRLRGRRVVYAFHDSALLRPNFAHLIALLVTDSVHHTVTNARELRSRKTPLRRFPEVIIPLVVDVERHSEIGERQRADLESRDIVFIGQVSPHKGTDLLLEAFLELAPYFPDITLQVVGGASDHSFETQLRNRAESSGLSGRISFLGYRENVFEVLDGAYVYVQASRPSRFHESFGRGVVEAMSLGIPSVVFRSGALQELVVHRETGLICEEESAGALASALRSLLSDRRLHERCSEGAKTRYRAYYASERTVPQWRAFFRGESLSGEIVTNSLHSERFIAP